MNLEAMLGRVDAATAQAFVRGARHLIDALLIESQRVRQAHTPGGLDYAQAGLSRETPAGGWIGDEELRAATQRMSEALATEKWSEGVMFALKALSTLGAI